MKKILKQGCDSMDIDKRLQMIRLHDEMQTFPELSRRIGLVDRSTFRGQMVYENTNTPPLSTKEPA